MSEYAYLIQISIICSDDRNGHTLRLSRNLDGIGFRTKREAVGYCKCPTTLCCHLTIRRKAISPCALHSPTLPLKSRKPFNLQQHRISTSHPYPSVSQFSF